MNFQPAHAAHAIDKVSISIDAQALVSSDEWLRVVERTIEFGRKQGLVGIEGFAAVGHNIQPVRGMPMSFNTQVLSSGVGFRQESETLDPLFDVVSNRNSVKVESFSYVRWAGFKSLALEFLKHVLGAYPDDFPFVALNLQYWDRFDSATLDGKWSEVFQEGRLPKWPLERNGNWHVHAGWFETLDRENCLMQLNVDTVDRIDIAPIGRRATAHVLVGIPLNSGSSATILNNLEDMMEKAHDLSKKIYSQILSPEMSERISLLTPAQQS